jgi:hypothetical protein
LDVKCSDARSFVYRGAVGDEFFILRIIVQIHVRPEQAIDKLSFLFLTAYAGDRS